MDNKWIRPYMRETEITSAQEMEITNVLDRIHKVHGLIEDAKIAKRIYGRTHMVSMALWFCAQLLKISQTKK